MANSKESASTAKTTKRSYFDRFNLHTDYRSRLPPVLSRFTGYRPPDSTAAYEPLPIPPFCWLKHVPLRYEIWLFGWVGSFGSMLLIEAIMSAGGTAFRDVVHAPLIVTSFGASAVLLFVAIESPLSQPRNFILGHFVAALLGTAITRLWMIRSDDYYQAVLSGNQDFHASVFVNGALCMATGVLGQLVLGAVHPPGGATALNAAVQAEVVAMSWSYIPSVLASCLIMLGWALVVNNLGRRRYPIYWWAPGMAFVSATKAEQLKEKSRELSEVERGLGVSEGSVFGRRNGNVSDETLEMASTPAS